MKGGDLGIWVVAFILFQVSMPRAFGNDPTGFATPSAAMGSPIVDPSSQAGARTSPQGALLKLDKMLDFVPGGGGLRCLLKDFEKIIQPEDYGGDIQKIVSSNVGIDRYVEQMASSRPFRARVKQFYVDVANVLEKDREDRPPAWNRSFEQPTLMQAAGDREHPHLEPGWLWRLALKHSDGNPNLAMKLIGICGNDDIAQGFTIPLELTPEEGQRRHQSILKQIGADITRIENNKDVTHKGQNTCDQSVKGAAFKNEILTANDMEQMNLTDDLIRICGQGEAIRILQEVQKSLEVPTTEYLTCPHGFGESVNFYLPRSLDKGADIPEFMKERIARIQGSDGDRKDGNGIQIPAKYYHVYGSAFVACEMIERGHDPALVVRLSGLAAWYYRVLALTAMESETAEASAGDITTDEASGWSDSLREILNFARSDTRKCDDSATPKADSMVAEGFNWGVNAISPAAKRDAFELLRRWTISGDLGAGMGTLYTNLPISLLYGPDAGLSIYQRPAGWSQSRFEAASRGVSMMMNDFEWTIQQHLVGARFAARHCRPDPRVERENSCEKAPGLSSSGTR